MLCYCRYSDDTFTASSLFFIVVVIPGHTLGNSQVSVNRAIGPTLVVFFVVSRFDFEGGTVVLIAPVSDRCLPF